MKILIVTGTTEPLSGLGRYSEAVVSELNRQGEKVLVLSGSGRRDATLFSQKGIVAIFRNLVIARKMARSVEVVHALDVWPFGVYALAAVLGRNKKLILGGIGTYSLPPEQKSVKRFLLLWAYRRAEQVLCISSYTQKRIANRLPFKCTMSVIHLAANSLMQPSGTIVENVRGKNQIPENAKIVLTVGEIKDRKGQLDTLRAIIELRKEIPELIYVIVGKGADGQYAKQIKIEALEHGEENSYRMIDDISTDEELAAWYSMGDIFVLASNNDGDHFEGFGLVFLEAGQFGVPGIGTKDCGIEDAIEDNVTGLLVPQRDPPAIVNAIQVILNDRARFSRETRNFVSGFSWERTIEAYRQAYYS